jgi:hypothetical protein
VVSLSGGSSFGCNFLDLYQIGAGELHTQCPDILLQITSLFRTRDRHNVLALCQ